MANLPRLPALSDPELRGPAVEVVKAWNMNLHRTLAHSPEMLGLWLPWAEKVLRGNTMPERDREIVILRIAIKWRSDYEWGLHATLAIDIGMTEADLRAIAYGPEDPHWGAFESQLIRGTDDILERRPINNESWEAISAKYTAQQIIDYIMTVGEFSLVAMTLTSLRVALEDRPNLRTVTEYLEV